MELLTLVAESIVRDLEHGLIVAGFGLVLIACAAVSKATGWGNAVVEVLAVSGGVCLVSGVVGPRFGSAPWGVLAVAAALYCVYLIVRRLCTGGDDRYRLAMSVETTEAHKELRRLAEEIGYEVHQS